MIITFANELISGDQFSEKLIPETIHNAIEDNVSPQLDSKSLLVERNKTLEITKLLH